MSQSPDTSLRTIVFTCVTSTICAAALAIAAVGLKGKQDENKRIDKMKNILKAFSVLDEAEKGGSLSDYFEANVEGVVVNLKGEILEDAPPAAKVDYQAELKKAAKTKNDKEPHQARLPVFVLKEDGKPMAYVIPVMGKGLWSTLLGYMSFENDANRVRGITFYSHAETPGLGAEIDAQWFQDNFKKDKKILDKEGRLVGIEVVKGQAADSAKNAEDLSHKVDGISGATITCRGVSDMIKKDLKNYAPYFATLRQEGR